MGQLLSDESGIVPQGNDAATPRTAQAVKPCAMPRKIFITQAELSVFPDNTRRRATLNAFPYLTGVHNEQTWRGKNRRGG
ncbi:hypothetical protein FZI51_12875 [Cronobacter sakazakii]|nr:hypothetical protein [Cronobacter sakazakii]KAB1467354.1 hypothetical protein FZI46_16040 [Cronobacter sakazakii]KAB1484435.1 hypothetical protein FZI51_12875 [Cronobacter sakazakii]KAB1501550.1 hypothetical protein FZH95_00510 [Cronobacter sakazakii]PPY31281.1 hypothetical protein C3D68_04990 [Cronobacter sakazakii]